MKRENEGLWYWLACGAVIIAAAAVRLRLFHMTLFEDEVWVAELIRDGGLRPHAHATPPLFFGVALCAVPLFAPLSRLTRFTWCVLLAFSSPLIFYSARVKQYTLEAFVAAVLLVLFLRWWETRSRATAFAFFAVAAIGVMGLHATILFVAAMAVVCLARPRMLVGFAAIFVLFGIAYFGWLKPGPAATALHGDMQEFFALTGRWVDSPRRLVDNTTHWTGQALNLVRFSWIAAALLLLVWLARERKAVLPLLATLPVLAVATLSVLHVYPYGEVRLLIFAFPAFFLLLAAALGNLANRVALLLLLLVPFVWSGVARDPYNRTYMQLGDLHELYATVARAHTTVYADPSFAAPLRYYHPETDVRSAIVDAPSAPGWYIQRAGRFTPRGASIVLREGNVLAARVP